MKGKPVILIVDDVPQNIELLEAHLAPQSYEIIKAVNGEEALEKLSCNQIDLILLDVMMPGMDGFEITRRVRQDNIHRLLPIILVTSLREKEDRIKGIEAGCDDFLSKPVDKIELLARVRSLLKTKDYNDLLSNYRKAIESEVTKRTDELAESNRMLEYEINQFKKLQAELVIQDRLASIGLLVAGVTHEIKSPLTSVIGFSDILLQKQIPKEIAEDLKIINDEAKRILQIVDNLLTFARKQPEGKAAIKINEQLNKVLAIRAHEHKGNNINVISRLAPDLPEIMGNSSQMLQVFFNLVVNAEQAILEAHNKGNLTIITERAGEVVRVTIADDGPGISPENMRKLFIPFFTTKPAGKGTGLGLSICHGIVTEHGGKIYAESETGKGAIFIVDLPICKNPNSPEVTN